MDHQILSAQDFFRKVVEPNFKEFQIESASANKIHNLCISLVAMREHWCKRNDADGPVFLSKIDFQLVRSIANGTKHVIPKADKHVFLASDETIQVGEVYTSVGSTTFDGEHWVNSTFGGNPDPEKAIQRTFENWRQLIENTE